jgi:chaperonin GroES
MAKDFKLKPLGGRIVVEPMEDEEELSIIIPDSAKEDTKPQKGKVIALGTGRVLDDGTKVDFNVKVGDIVFFKQYAPDDITVQEGKVEKTYLIMDESDVLAIIS